MVEHTHALQNIRYLLDPQFRKLIRQRDSQALKMLNVAGEVGSSEVGSSIEIKVVTATADKVYIPIAVVTTDFHNLKENDLLQVRAAGTSSTVGTVGSGSSISTLATAMGSLSSASSASTAGSAGSAGSA